MRSAVSSIRVSKFSAWCSAILLSSAAVAQTGPATPDAQKAPVAGPGPGGPVIDPPAPADAAAEGDEAAYGTDVGGVEVLVVTGSRIGRTNTDSYGNVSVVTADDIQRSGVASVEDLLNELPTVTLQGINRNNNNGGEGLAFVDLRNLSSARTLVLVNGRRFVPTTSGTTEAVDLNNIPVAMVERVEILLDGASAVYGSDAIGGVVNVILKDNFDGAEVRMLTAVSQRGDAATLGLAGTLGHNFEKGNVTFNLGYQRRNPVSQRNRAWANDPIVDASVNPDGTLDITRGSAFTPDGTDFYTGSVFRPTFDANGNQLSSFQALDPSTRHNYGGDQWLVGSFDRFNVTALGHYNLGGSVKAYTEGMYIGRYSAQQLSGQPVHTGNATYPDFGLFVPNTNPYIPADYLASVAGDPDAPGGVILGWRSLDVGPRQYRQNADTFRLVGGLTGDFFSEDHVWDLSLNFGRSRGTNVTRNSINLTRLRETVDPAICNTPDNQARGCVVGNYFGRNLQPEVANYIRYDETELIGYDQSMIEGSVNGKLVELIGGQRLSYAVGADWRRVAGFTQPDVIVAGGDAASNGQDPTAGSYNVGSAFAEVSAPLISKLPLVEELTVDLAGRFSMYNTFGNAFTYRVGLAYAPVRDIKLRSNFSTAFRAPSVIDLFGGASDSYEDVADPCSNYTAPGTDPVVAANCAAAGVPADYDQENYGSQARTNVGGNRNLQAETAGVFNAGAVIQPRFVPGLTLTADFYRLVVDNAIEGPNPQTVLDRCYNSPGLSDPFCASVKRSPGQGSITGLEAGLMNIGSIVTRGLDFSVAYDLPFSRLGFENGGTLSAGWQGNYLLQYDEILFGEVDHYAGTIDAFTGSLARFRWNLMLRYLRERWSVSGLLRFIGPAERFGIRDETGAIPADVAFPTVREAFYFDLAASYRMGRFTIMAGIDNLFDKDPPYTLDSGQNANANTYDFIGRFVHAQVAYEL